MVTKVSDVSWTGVKSSNIPVCSISVDMIDTIDYNYKVFATTFPSILEKMATIERQQGKFPQVLKRSIENNKIYVLQVSY